MPDTPAVSVVIPAYNRAASIRTAIESVLAQSWRDLELIVVDDGSSDGTVEAVRGIDDPRIRLVLHETNRGAAAARNTGIAEARAPWVAFQDSDDEWLPGKLEKQMARLTAPGADFVASYCGMIVVGRHFQGQGERPQVIYIPNARHREVAGDILSPSLRTSLVSNQTLVAHRDTLRQAGGFDETLPALIDWECVLRLAQRGRFDFVDEPLVLQRFSQNSITGDPARRIRARARVIEKHRTLFAAHPRVLAHQYRSLAGDLRRIGDHAGARSALAQARALRPTDWRLWAISAGMLAPSLLPDRQR